jgi:hypothetical protein
MSSSNSARNGDPDPNLPGYIRALILILAAGVLVAAILSLPP